MDLCRTLEPCPNSALPYSAPQLRTRKTLFSDSASLHLTPVGNGSELPVFRLPGFNDPGVATAGLGLGAVLLQLDVMLD